MATDHRFDPYGDQPTAEKRQRSWLESCLIGCLIGGVILLVVGGLVVYWVTQSWRGWVSDISTAGIAQAVDSTDLPPEEKQEIKVEVDRLANAFREKTVSSEQVAMVVKELMESPLVTTIIVSTVDRAYFEKSGLSDEEKTEGKRTLQRFVRGVIDRKIDEDSMNAALAHVADRKPDGSWQLRQQVTDEQLRAFLETAKTKADEAQIPEEPPVFDPSDEVKRIIDQAMDVPLPNDAIQ